MNKLITKVVGAALGLTMAIGVGVAVASSNRSNVVPARAANPGSSIYTSGTPSFGTAYSYGNKTLNSVDWYFSTCGNSTSMGWNKSSQDNTASATLSVLSNISQTTKIGAYQTSAAFTNAQKITVTVSNLDSVSGAWYVWYSTNSGSTWTQGTTATLSSSTTAFTYDHGSKIGDSVYFAFGYGTTVTTKTRINLSGIQVWEASSASYTVSFNSNGGSGSMSSVPDVSGSYTLPSCTFTAPNGKAFIGWKANNSGDTIAAGSSYNVSADVAFYAQWADAYTVTYTAGSNGSGSYAHTLQPAGNYSLLSFANLTGVTASSGYRFKNYTVGGVNKNPNDTITLSGATAVTVNFEEIPLETTYDFVAAWGWGTTYGPQTIDGKTEASGDYDATIALARADIQSSGVGIDRPYLCGNTNADAKMITFTLTETGFKIVDVLVTFQQRGSNAPVVKLFKGDTNSGTALDTATIGAKNTLSTSSSLNDTVFTVTLNAGGTSNKGVALTSIYISIEPLASFGTLDHISITGLPNVVYHVGETFDPTGLTVVAYDGAEEATANFKDVTSEVETDLDNPAPFVEGDVPGFDCDVQYSGDGGSDTTSFHVYVYALAEYDLVTSEPADWSGSYLIVCPNTVEAITTNYAMNGGLSNLDVEGNHKTVTPDVNDAIETGQELEWTIASYSTGYSIQGKSGKYIGWASGSGNGLTVSDNALVNTLSYSDGAVIIAGSGGRHLTFNDGGEGRFRYYTNGTVQLYKLKASDNADAYAQLFLSTLSTGEGHVCQYNESTHEVSTDLAALKVAWKSLAEEYASGAGLTPAEKEQFRIGVPSSEESASNIAKALALYDHIATAYGTLLHSEGFSNYNFMNRTITPLHSNIVLNNTVSNNAGVITIIVIALVLSIASVGAYFLLKKRKEQ